MLQMKPAHLSENETEKSSVCNTVDVVINKILNSTRSRTEKTKAHVLKLGIS